MDDSNVVRTAGPRGSSGRTLEDVLRPLILDGIYPPGTKLSDAKLAIEFGIGRAGIREAFVRLAKDGYVETIANRGTFVKSLDPGEVGELFEVRDVLEARAAELATRNASRSDIEDLNRLLVVAHIRLEEERASYPREIEFHDQILQIAGNATLASTAQSISSRLRLARARVPFSLERASEAHAEHVRILDAVRGGDAEAASLAMHDHIQNAKETLERALLADQMAGLRASPGRPRERSQA